MTAPDTARFAPRARVDISGVTLAADVSRHLISVRYDNNVELADMVTLVLDNSGHRFTDSPLFEPGKTAELYMGYGELLHPMMLGEIASIEPSFPQSGAPTLTVSAYDRSQGLRHAVPDRPAFRFTNDSLMATQIALEAGLIPVVDPSPFPPKESLPRTAPDMAILKERALANFFEVYVHWDKLYFRFPRPQTEIVELTWGGNLSSFSPRLSRAGLAGVQVVRGYNEDLAQEIVGVATTAALDLDAMIERLGSAGVSALATLGRRVVSTGTVKSPLDAAALAKALLQDILEGLYEANGSCIGLPELRAGSHVQVTGVGRRFSGRYRLNKVTHALDQGGYRTDFEVTQRAEASLLSLLRKQTTETPPPDRRPTVNGVVVATVRSVDPLRYQVDVHFPPLPEKDTVPARCTTFLAGDGRGAYALPAVDDQVLVAFADGDITQGYVLGSVWSLADGKPARERGVHRLRSGAGHTVTLDDTRKTIVVEHPKGSSITMAADGSVTVAAKAGLALSAESGDLTLTAKDGGITLTAAATKDITLKANNVDVGVSKAMNVGART